MGSGAYVEQFGPSLVDVVMAWCGGAKFVDVVELSDWYEGSIIRTFHRLEEMLRAGDLKLLCSKWLIAQPDGYSLESRQELEAREQLNESPLLTCEEAVEAILSGDRRIGALTYPWAAATHPGTCTGLQRTTRQYMYFTPCSPLEASACGRSHRLTVSAAL